MPLKLNSSGGGSVTVQEPSTASNVTLNLPAATGTVVYESSSGIVNIASTGARITGDFSNATLANRVMFQTSTANAASVVGVIANGTSTISQFAAYGGSDPNNAQVMRIDTRGGSESRIETTYAGTPASGTYLPMTFYTGGSERMRVDTSGNVGIGTASPTGKLDVVGTVGALVNAIVRSSDGNMSRLTLSNTNRNWTISNYGTQFSPNGNLVFADETAGATRAWLDTSGNFAFNSGYGSVATAYGCRAWVNFNGTGTVAIRASGNVSSITDSGVGTYTVNFTNAMPDANYSVCFSPDQTLASGVFHYETISSATTSGFSILCSQINNGGATCDPTTVRYAVFR
jgi:hypothetical protein